MLQLDLQEFDQGFQERMQTGSQEFRGRDERGREFKPSSIAKRKRLMQERGLTHDQEGAGRAARQTFSGDQATIDREAQRLMQETGMTHAGDGQAQFTQAWRGATRRPSSGEAIDRETAKRWHRDQTFAGAALDREAQQLMQERGLTHEEAHGRRRSARSLAIRRPSIVSYQERMQDRGLTHEQAQAELDRETQRLMQERGLTHEEAQGELRRQFAGDQATIDREAQRLMQERGLTHEEAQNEARQTFASEQADIDREAQRLMQERGLTHEEAQAEERRGLQQRQTLDNSVRDINTQYQRWMTALTSQHRTPGRGAPRDGGAVCVHPRSKHGGA